MAEIAACCSVVGKVVDLLFGPIKTEIGYMWNCTQHVEKFKNEVEKLKVMKGRVQQQIDVANTKGDNLKHGVEKWVEDADQEISKAEVCLEQEACAKKTCFKIGMCGNWATLHHYGKIMATKMTPALLQLQASGTPYEGGHGVSVNTRAPRPLDAYQKKNLEDLDTHNSALGDIITALEDESKQIIGIYGLGGVGKTTLANEAVARVKSKMLFADVALTTVSHNVDVEKIKKDLESATKRIMKGDKILIILDDVWETLDLQELCIPFGNNHKNCKILLTSRNESVCDSMNAQSKICVNSLPTAEAWILFKRVVGERLETEADSKPVAEEVAKECGGLPLLIQAVGSTLKNKSISWKSALSQLKKPAPSKIHPDIRKAFTRLKLSYDYLETDEAKSCFLLCSLFPEDCDIWLEDLVIYGVGLEKFDDLDSIEDARDRVQNAVNILTSSGLLLNSQREGYTKMHDVVREVALLIASQGNNKFLVKAGLGLTEWPPIDNNPKSYTGISLMNNHIIKLPDYKVNVPHLEIFLVQRNRGLSMISDEFIGCMKEVKVLDISWNNISSLPQSLQLLTKLRMLDLRGNESLREISILGELKDLEILILNETGIAEIPKEIGRLVNLRVLEVKDCENLSRITRGVIPALWRLEELCIEFWLNFNGASDCIAEVMSLSKLTYLDLTVPSIDDISAQCFNSEKLKGFVIQIGDEYNRDNVNLSRSDRSLILSIVHLRIPLVKWLKKLIEGSRPHIYLIGIQNLNNIMPTMYDEGFNKLEHIELFLFPNVSCLVDDSTSCNRDQGKTKEKYFMELKHLKLIDLYNLEVLWKCPDEYISLANLVRLYIYSCNKLVRVFTVSVAQGLVNLKDLRIKHCKGLEEVIYGGGGDDESGNVIVFPSLANITLGYLKSLKSFFNSAAAAAAGNCSIKYPSLVDVRIYDCKSMEMWGPGIHETPNLKTLAVNGDAVVLLDGPSALNEAVAKEYEDRQKWPVQFH